MENSKSFVQYLCYALTVVFLSVSVQGFLINGLTSVLYWSVFVAGLAVAWVGFRWPSYSENRATAFVESAQAIASDARVWLGLVVVILIYAMVIQTVSIVQRDKYAEIIEEDIVPFRIALQKWVIPRRLKDEQIEAIANYLQGRRSETIHFTIHQHDPEASGLAQDLRQAIEGGGWIIKHIDYETELQSGLRLDVRFPRGISQPSRNDPRNPPPEQVLREAFRSANVQIGGGSSGSGPAELDEVIVTLEIGPRRTGMHAEIQEWPF